MNDIKEEIYKCNDINKFNLYERFLKKFNTDAIPEFLKRNILDEIETKKLIKCIIFIFYIIVYKYIFKYIMNLVRIQKKKR